MYYKQPNRRIFCRTVTFLCAIALLLTAVSVVGDTWAWFTDHKTASVSQIQAASYRSKTSLVPYVQPTAMVMSMSMEEPVETEPAQSADITPAADGTYQLKPGNYVLTLGRSEDSTASTGYCTIQTASGFTAHTGTLTQPITILLNILPLAEDDYETPDTLVITSSWGTYENNGSTGFSLFDPLCLEDGMIVNTLGEVLTDIPVMELPDTPGYIAASEHPIPLYYQTDYPDNRYGAGSIASSGCGIVSLAMVANYMTGHSYDIQALARWFGGRAENNIQRMEIAATEMGLPWVKAENINEATAALYEGKIVIMMMDGFHFENPFTTSQHFVVVRGITEDGRYLINDPNALNYGKWELKEGFERGFAKDTLVSGYSGAWVFDPNALPEDYQPYVKEEYPRQDNYPGVDLTFEEQELLAKLIWAEARGECAEGQQAVAEVVLNRLVSGKFANSIAGIIIPSQFNGYEKMEEATPWQAQYDAIDAARYGKPVLEPDVFYFGTSALTSQVFATIGGHVFCREELVPETTEPTVPETTEPTEPTVPETTEATEPTVPETTEATEPTVPETTEATEPTVPETTEATEPTVPETTEATEPQPQSTEEPEFPSYYQSDYADVPYGEGTIGDHGSSIVALAMAASHLTGYEYTPEMLAEWFRDSAEDDIARLEAAADTLQLPWALAETLEDAAQAADEDQLLILRLEPGEDSPSLFTEDVHFILVRGRTGEGKYLVSDPNKDNSGKEELTAGFEDGFRPEEVFSGCTHAWVLDPEGISEEFTPYTP